MRRSRSFLLLVVVGLMLALVAGTVPSMASAATSGQQSDLGTWISPSPALSSSGDFATDVFGDPWDFSNQEDLIAVNEVGTHNTPNLSIANGMLNATMTGGATIRLLFNWPGVVPWGRDGWANPIDGARYTQTTFRICTQTPGLAMAVRFENASKQRGTLPFTPPTGCSIQHFDLTYQGPVPGRDLQYPFVGDQGPWAGPIVRFELFLAGGQADVQLDWVRVHRADAPQEPPTDIPIPQVLTPNIEGGDDYATVERGNPWDLTGPDDVSETNGLRNTGYSGSGLTATTTNNDPFVGLRLGPDLNTDRYHRLTVHACYDGPFSLAGTPGGGMVGRFAWIPRGYPTWTETQDFVVFPGCHRMTIDLATNPAGAIQDEDSQYVTGWRGMRPNAVRFDFHEDPGARNVALRQVKLADDAAFDSTYDITFRDTAALGGTADVYVTTNRGQFDGTRIGSLAVGAGGAVNTFRWNGTNAAGAAMPNGTYWVYVVMTRAGKVGVGTSTGPVRLQKPVPSTPSYFVPVVPARILDTRNGIGGNITPLGSDMFTEVDVTGVGGVPETGVTAVVMNVTVDAPQTSGFLTVSPSREPRPKVSNLNFVAGQTVPNLVTVKVGANGKVDMYNQQGATSVIADIVGYYTATPVAGGLYTPVTPGRLLDTRDGTGRLGALGTGETFDLQVTNAWGVPDTGVSAVALNITVDGPTGGGYVTAWPAGELRPTTSSLNFVPGLTVANLAISKVGAGGKVSLYNFNGSTHLVVDVVGYFSSSGGAFVPVAPKRLVDSRDGTGGMFGPLRDQGSVVLALADGNPVPANATGAVLNITSADATAPSFLTAWPAGETMPKASTLNPRPGVPVPNQAYLKLRGGSLSVFNHQGQTALIVDVFGYVL